MATVSCPECSARIQTGRQAYKHALHCMNLKDKGVEQITRDVSKDGSMYGERVRELMVYAAERSE